MTVCRPVATGGDWALVLPTPKLAATSLLSPEKFVQISPAIEKLFMICQNTDTHKQITPVPYTSTDEEKFMPCFFYLSQNGVSLPCLLTPFRSGKYRKAIWKYHLNSPF